MTRLYTVCAFGGAESDGGSVPKDLSIGNVYFCSQSRRVEDPKIPALGYWEACICVSNTCDKHVAYKYCSAMDVPLTYKPRKEKSISLPSSSSLDNRHSLFRCIYRAIDFWRYYRPPIPLNHPVQSIFVVASNRPVEPFNPATLIQHPQSTGIYFQRMFAFCRYLARYLNKRAVVESICRDHFDNPSLKCPRPPRVRK